MRGWREAEVAGWGEGMGALWMFSRTDLVDDGGGGRVIGMEEGSGAGFGVVASGIGVVGALNAIFLYAVLR